MAQLENKICEYCGKEFTQNSPVQKYCSADCRFEHARKHKQANFISKKGTVEKNCAICGKPFLANTLSQIYCSTECKVVAGHEKARQYRKEQQKKKAEAKRKEAEIKKATLSLQEICRKAFAEHLSYGKYCQKYGL